MNNEITNSPTKDMRDEFHENIARDPLATTVAYYASCLLACSKAVAYLIRNCLVKDNLEESASDKGSCLSTLSQSQVRSLQIGFSDRTLGKQLPTHQLKPGRQIRLQLQKCDILKATGHETFRGMITVPLSDRVGTITGIYGRRLDVHTARGEDRLAEQYIGSGIFNASALSRFDEIIVAQSIVDAWVFYAAGYENVVATYQYALQASDLVGVKRLLLSGENVQPLNYPSIQSYRLRFPEEQTAYSLMRTNRAAKRYGSNAYQNDPLGEIVRAASWVPTTEPMVLATGDAAGLVLLPDVAADLLDANVSNDEATSASMLEANNEVSDVGNRLPLMTPEASAYGSGKHSERPLSSPVPIAVDDLDVSITDSDITITSESRRYRVRGLERNATSGVMKVNLLIYNERTDRFHVDCFDLYHARSRRMFTAEAAEEIGVNESQLRSELGRVLLKLEEIQVQQKERSSSGKLQASKKLTPVEEAAALELLKSENLLERILSDFDDCGVVGERTAKLTGYLAATSRLLDRPLGLVIQSSSAAGKSSLMDAILSFMPPEHSLALSAMTGQSLYYAGNLDLRHKILSIAEEEGVREASYSLKILQSEGKLSIASTGKEAVTGQSVVQMHQVEGPVALMLTTTASSVDPELMNRCLVISVDESATQTQSIHASQRQSEMLRGFERKGKWELVKRIHQNAQRMLSPLMVINPYADQLTFVGSQTRHRRDHLKYLTIIRSVALLHQYQRERLKTVIDGKPIEYIEVTRRDIALANQIADWSLGRSIDELPGPSRRLLVELYDWLRGQVMQENKQQNPQQHVSLSSIKFTRRAAREALHWNATQLAYHLEQLCKFEYVVPFGRGTGKLFQYSLLYDGRGREGQPALAGLIDASLLKEPKETDILPTSRVLSGPIGLVNQL